MGVAPADTCDASIGSAFNAANCEFATDTIPLKLTPNLIPMGDGLLAQIESTSRVEVTLSQERLNSRPYSCRPSSSASTSAFQGRRRMIAMAAGGCKPTLRLVYLNRLSRLRLWRSLATR